MLAVLGRHTDCVHILLEKGAKADAADKKGFTALHRAVSICYACLCVFPFLFLFLFFGFFFNNALNYVTMRQQGFCPFSEFWMVKMCF